MSVGVPLDDQYFEWLYSQIGSLKNRNPRLSHWQLARVLYQTEFDPFVPNDENRAEDGRDLREEFMDQYQYDADSSWRDLPCSMLEMLVALGRRAMFIADEDAIEGGAAGWFWHMMDNLELSGLTDYEITQGSINLEAATYIIGVVNRREYKRTGVGGLFPLSNAKWDQRKVELWYQLNSYIQDKGFVDLSFYED